MLLTEAAYRGYASGDAKSYYELGVRAAMEQFAQFGVSGMNGTIPRRFTYPSDEATINKNNYLQAIGNLKDGDTMTSRVWWDKE